MASLADVPYQLIQFRIRNRAALLNLLHENGKEARSPGSTGV